MLRRILSAVMALTLFAGVASFTAPQPAAAAGLCANSTQTNEAYIVYKWYENLPSQGRFDRVTSELYVEDLANCTGPGIGSAQGTTIMGANIETPLGIFQVGYQDNWVNGKRFIYADRTTAVKSWPGSLTPVVGRQYKFAVTLPSNAAQFVTYTITDLSTGAVNNVYGQAFGGGSSQWGYLAWWGAERLDSVSELGASTNGANTNIHRMSYRNGPQGTTYFRDGLASRTGNTDDINNTGGSGGQIFDMYKHVQLQPAACFHGSISSTNSTNDTFDPWTDQTSC